MDYDSRNNTEKPEPPSVMASRINLRGAISREAGFRALSLAKLI
jgi:hypothetical protein